MSETLSGVLPAEAVAGSDEARFGSMQGGPEAVVSPGSDEEAVAVMSWAAREGVAVVPVGSGARLRPGRPAARFVAMTSDRLRGVEIYEPADLTFTAGAGTRLGEIDAALRPNEQWLPVDLPGAAARSLGGVVARGDAGPLWMGYGALRNHVLGMTVVTGDGRVLRLGGRVVKNVAGFDLLKPMVGSRGRLAFITSLCLRAFPEPRVELTLSLEADRGALENAAGLVGTAPVLPVSSVLTIEAGGRARLVVRLHGSAATVAADRSTLEQHVGVVFVALDGAVDEERSSEESARSSGEARVELLATVRPSELGAALDALALLPDHDRVTVDTYSASLRIESDSVRVEAVTAFGRALESLGGALAIERAPADSPIVDLGTERGAGARALEEGVAASFDPGGVLWR